MSFRITTNMSMKSYRYNLNKVNTKTNNARESVLTQRNFNSYAEDPAAATQAFRLRRSYWQTTTHLNNNEDAYNKFNTAWTAAGAVVEDLSDKTARASAVAGITGTAGESRTALGQVLKETAKSVIQTMNVQYGDQFIFAGNDALHVPFTWDENNNLLYRGINVSSKETADQAMLKQMAAEQQYLDIGLGLKENAPGSVIEGSAFDMALPGIEILGYGVDEDGDPKNLAILMYQLGEIFSRCDSESGEYETTKDQETATRLLDKINAAHDKTTERYVELDTRAQFLQTNSNRLSDQQAALNEQILSVEQIDMADAITEFSWQQYCYNAALKIGNQLLGQTLIDYMN